MKHLNEGEVFLVQGSGKKPYEIKMIGGTVSCSCIAWRMQSLPIDQRTCKHIKANISNGFGGVSNEPVVIVPKDKNPPPCILANVWDESIDVTDWIVQPKLDGCRAWWDGKTFWSRLGNEYFAPQWFKDQMPKDVVLDGELFAGNGSFQETVSIVRKGTPNDEEWKEIRFLVFDLPESKQSYYKRLMELKLILPESGRYERPVDVLDWDVLFVPKNKTYKDMVAWHLELNEKYGSEGIMLRDPDSLYTSGRTSSLLKVKSFLDCEVTVIGYQKGKGKHKGVMGSLDVRMDSGVEFNVGTGFSDEERRNPPKIGSRITIKYQELSRDSVPRFPSYLRETIDK